MRCGSHYFVLYPHFAYADYHRDFALDPHRAYAGFRCDFTEAYDHASSTTHDAEGPPCFKNHFDYAGVDRLLYPAAF